MDFTFTEDQLLLRDTASDFLRKEVTTERIRELWETDSGRSDELWRQLSRLGLTSLLVPEDCGGQGLDEVDFILLAQECGYVALPEPVVQTALVAVPLLQAIGGELAARWLPQVAAGTVRVALGSEQNPWVEDAHVAGLILLQQAGEFHALGPGQVQLRPLFSVDPSRKLFEVTPLGSNPVAGAADLGQFALDRGALANAAQCLGLAQRMLDLTVQYTGERQQFGKPIGSFQAVKHLLANVALSLEFAKAPVYRAAYAAARQSRSLTVNVAQAKLAAGDAVQLAARNCMQAHGAMGYTWEADLHIFSKRAWALASGWGDAACHKARLSEFILAPDAPLGAGHTFFNQ